MKTNYVTKTIQAYDDNPQKYMELTKDMIDYPKVEKFLQQIPFGESILDAGCGFGRDARVFTSKGYKITGIDLSEKLLEQARNLSPKFKSCLRKLRKELKRAGLLTQKKTER